MCSLLFMMCLYFCYFTQITHLYEHILYSWNHCTKNFLVRFLFLQKLYKKRNNIKMVAFKDKSRILLVLTFDHSDLNILSYRSWRNNIWCKLNFFEFLTWRPISLSNFRGKRSHMREMIFLRWHMNSVSRQVLWRNKSKVLLKASKPISESLFQQFSSSKLKVKAWRFYAMLFLFF